MLEINHITHLCRPSLQAHTKAQVDAVAQAIADHLPAMQYIAAHDGEDPHWLHLAAEHATPTDPAVPECWLRTDPGAPLPDDTLIAVDVHPLVDNGPSNAPHYTVYLRVSRVL